MAKKQTVAAWALGKSIRGLREFRGLTMQGLADRAAKLGLRLPLRTLSDLERGQRKDPQLSTLLAVAGGLGVELSRLVAGLDTVTSNFEEEPTMINHPDPIEALRRKIERKDSLIRKWTQAADRCDASDIIGRATKRYCRGLARWQEEEQEKLEAKMRELRRKGRA